MRVEKEAKTKKKIHVFFSAIQQLLGVKSFSVYVIKTNKLNTPVNFKMMSPLYRIFISSNTLAVVILCVCVFKSFQQLHMGVKGEALWSD